MSLVNRNTADMPVPDFAYTDRHDGRVFTISVDTDGTKQKKTIGYMTDSTPGSQRMIPNRRFKETYTDLWREYYPDEELPAHEMSIGMYALTLQIATKSGLYKILTDVYGPLFANNILDYCMFCIQHRSTVTQMFEKNMSRQVLFCDTLRSDSWYSGFFSGKINEDMNHRFRIRWVQKLVENGLKSVWLCIDGSNNDCEARQSHLAKFGFPKSHNANKTIVGYMYVVDAETGRPVTYYVYNGSVPDSQAFQIISTFLGGFHINIEGIILDRGFAVDSVFESIEEHKWKYVIMLPGDTSGHTSMLEQYSETIRWKSEYALENDTLFGTSAVQRLFAAHGRTSWICLFFDGAGGSTQSIRIMKKVQIARKKIQQAINNGSRASVAKSLGKYLTIEGEGSERKIVTNYAALDACMAAKGFYSMAVSEGISPERANELYKMRDPSETQYCILKTQEGGQTTRVHSTEGIQSKFAMLFISSIIRFEISSTCKEMDFDTNPFIQELNEIILLYTAEDKYEAVRNLTAEQKEVLAKYDFQQEDLEHLAKEYNSRGKKDSKNPDRTLPADRRSMIQKNTRKKGRPSSKPASQDLESQPPAVKSKGGRPRGVKDSAPRKQRSDKGKKRGPRIKK